MNKSKIDPRIEIKVIPDGEIHIVFTWTDADLEQFAMAFLAAGERKVPSDVAKSVFRLRTREGIDYLIGELQRARVQLFGEG